MVTPEHPAYAVAQRIQRARGRELLDRHGAHALSIQWAPVGPGGDVEPVLVFHVPATGAQASQVEPVPPSIEGQADDGRVLSVTTRVQQDPPAQFQ